MAMQKVNRKHKPSGVTGPDGQFFSIESIMIFSSVRDLRVEMTQLGFSIEYVKEARRLRRAHKLKTYLETYRNKVKILKDEKNNLEREKKQIFDELNEFKRKLGISAD